MTRTLIPTNKKLSHSCVGFYLILPIPALNTHKVCYFPSGLSIIQSVVHNLSSRIKKLWICVGGLMFKLPQSNLQYVTSITFLLTTYSKYMSAAKHTFNCGGVLVTPTSLKNLAKQQVTNYQTPSFLGSI